MLNFLLLYLPVHPLKESCLLKFIQDAVKLQCLLPCYVVCFHYLIQSVLGMLLDLAKFNRGGIHWLHHMLHVFLYTELHCLLPLLYPLTGSQLLRFTRTGATSSCPCSVSKGTPACSSSLRSLLWTVDSPLLSGDCVTSGSASFVSI